MNKTEIPDEHAGKGGSYVIENGKRVLQERTDRVVGAIHESPDPATSVAPKTQPKVKGANNA